GGDCHQHEEERQQEGPHGGAVRTRDERRRRGRTTARGRGLAGYLDRAASRYAGGGVHGAGRRVRPVPVGARTWLASARLLLWRGRLHGTEEPRFVLLSPQCAGGGGVVSHCSLSGAYGVSCRARAERD